MKKIIAIFFSFGFCIITYGQDCTNCFDDGPNGCGSLRYYDNDKDGYGTGSKVCYFPSPGIDPDHYSRKSGDCDDNNPGIYPKRWYVDSDGDGYGESGSIARSKCFFTDNPIGWSRNNLDCNDTMTEINIAANWYADADGDGFGNSSTVVNACAPPTSMPNPVNVGGDYDDTKTEITNVAPRTFYFDNDNDGFGTNTNSEFRSNPSSAKYISINGDCNDNRPDLNPDTVWYLDSDGDGLGYSSTKNKVQCTKPENLSAGEYVLNNGDVCPTENGPVANNGCYEQNPIMASDLDRNWIWSISYDAEGKIKGNGISYYDDLGKAIQNQKIDVATGRIWADQTLYDKVGRPALQTLGAPIGNQSSFEYKEDFIKNQNGNIYSDIDFETDENNPNAVATQTNTLGWYYSEQNNDSFYKGNNYQDITSLPFTRTIFSKMNTGMPLRTVGGNKPDTDGDGDIDSNDEWPQPYVFTMRASQELSKSNAFGELKYDDYKISKTVSRDVHGNENIVFTDSDGKVVAAARSGDGPSSGPMNLIIKNQGYVDVHVPKGITGFTVSLPNAVTVYDLITEMPVSGGTSSMQNGFYRISVNDLKNYNFNSNPIAVTYQANYYDYSLNEYDEAGRLIESFQPIGATKALKQSTVYEYDALGRLIHSISPDEGESWFKYRKDGQIRFSQNSKQKIVDTNDSNDVVEFSYTNYDFRGRPTSSGVLSGVTFDSNLNPDEANLPSGGTKLEEIKTTYDNLETNDRNALPAGYKTPSYLSGNVAKTENENSTTYYSYDIYGRVKWMVQDIHPIGFKTIDYEYHPVSGLVTKVIYQKDTPSERFIHKYEYNYIDQLVKVLTSLDDIIFTENAEYKYYETGGLRRVEYADNLQGMDYVYNLNGQLKAINNPSLQGVDDLGHPDNDLFGVVMDYHNADYKRAVDKITATTYGQDRYSGDIKGVRWNNKQFENSSASAYKYEYDRNNWLTGAFFGTYEEDNSGVEENKEFIGNLTSSDGPQIIEGSNSVTILPNSHFSEGSDVLIRAVSANGFNEVNGDYNVTGLEYDANGNILKLNRKKNTNNGNNAMDDLDYVYDPQKPNQLKRIDDSNGDVNGAEDIGDQVGDAENNNYHYNEIGQLIEDWEYVTESQRQAFIANGTIPANIIRYKYNASGLVTEVTKNFLPLVKFYYNDRNHRVKKQSFDGQGNLISTTYYVRDAAGNVAAIHSIPASNSSITSEYPIQGQGRIGMFKRSGSSGVANYELSDHLGNVRAVFSVDNSSIAFSDFNDYYPGGMAMPGRNIVGDYRYNYQGQELDPETGKVAFELRLYDPRINRWLTTDPAGQYASPYLSMGNNWVSRIDPDGGVDDIFLNDDGTVASIIRNDDPNRFFASDGTELFFNDTNSLDQNMLTREFNIDDQIFIPVSLGDYRSMMKGAGFEPARYNIRAAQARKNGDTDGARANKALALASAAKKSGAYQPADFTKSQLEGRFNVPSGTGRGGFDNETAAYFRFGDANRIYNWYDAGNHLWGGWMHLNGFTMNEVITGSNLLELSRFNFGDTQADQIAIKNGFLLKGYGN